MSIVVHSTLCRFLIDLPIMGMSESQLIFIHLGGGIRSEWCALYMANSCAN